MKHLVIDARESGTSTGRYIDKLIEYLHKLPATHKQFQVTLLAKPHRLEYLAGIAPRFSLQSTDHKEFTFAEQFSLKEQIERLQPDLVFFPAVQQPVWLARRNANGLPIRVVTTMQDLTTLRFRNPAKNPVVFTVKQQVYRWVNHRVARRSTLLITPSEFVKQDVVQFSGVSPDKITVTYEAADDLPKPAEPVASLKNKAFIMYLGRPTPHKNLERLVQAFAKLHADHPDLYLALAGKRDANYQRIADLATRQGIGQVIFTDFISDRQLRWMYEHCQAYVFPSLSEGFGLPALEAMRHGAPVASSNATCLPEIYGPGAHYFDPLSVDDMAAKINDILTDPKLRHQLIKAGQKQAGHYSWRRMAEQSLEVFEKALKSNS